MVTSSASDPWSHFFTASTETPATPANRELPVVSNGHLPKQLSDRIKKNSHHAVTDLENSRLVDCVDDAVPARFRYAVIVPQPIFDVPAILEECPDIVLVVDVASRLMRLDTVEKPSSPVELSAITGTASHGDDANQRAPSSCRPDLLVPHEDYLMCACEWAAGPFRSKKRDWDAWRGPYIRSEADVGAVCCTAAYFA